MGYVNLLDASRSVSVQLSALAGAPAASLAAGPSYPQWRLTMDFVNKTLAPALDAAALLEAESNAADLPDYVLLHALLLAAMFLVLWAIGCGGRAARSRTHASFSGAGCSLCAP